MFANVLSGKPYLRVFLSMVVAVFEHPRVAVVRHDLNAAIVQA